MSKKKPESTGKQVKKVDGRLALPQLFKKDNQDILRADQKAQKTGLRSLNELLI